MSFGVCRSGSVDAKYLVSIDFHGEVPAIAKMGSEPIQYPASANAQWKQSFTRSTVTVKTTVSSFVIEMVRTTYKEMPVVSESTKGKRRKNINETRTE